MSIGCTILSDKGKEKEWDSPGTYIDILGDGEVAIAVTEDGLADSVQSVEGTKVFLKPLNEEMGIKTFLTKLCKHHPPTSLQYKLECLILV